MSRKPKPPKVDLSALEHLPNVLKALRYLADMGEQVGALAPRLAMAPRAPASTTTPAAQVPTVDARAAWLEQNNDGDVQAALNAEKIRGQNQLPAGQRRVIDVVSGQQPKKTLAQLPAGQRRAIENGFLAEAQAERAAKMAQFVGGGSLTDAGQVIDSQEITTLSETT